VAEHDDLQLLELCAWTRAALPMFAAGSQEATLGLTVGSDHVAGDNDRALRCSGKDVGG
jgi:hypothetical protein